MKSIEYNKLKFTSGNTEQDLIDYYMSDENKAHPFIKYLPKNANRQRIINTPIFQEIHTGYNPYSKSLKSISINSPNIIDYEITIDDDNIFSNNNINTSNYKLYSKPDNYKNENQINNNHNHNFLSTVKENQNRVRSPRIIRNNNLNINDDINNNYEMMLKSNSFSNLSKRSQSPKMKVQDPNFNSMINFINNSNNYNSLL